MYDSTSRIADRVAHVGLRVADLNRSVSFAESVLGLRETERDGSTAYLTCNSRHHELVLIESEAPGCDHLNLREGAKTPMGQGDVVVVHPHEWHGFENDTDDTITILTAWGGVGSTEEAGYEDYPGPLTAG
jgi:catechol 2,3-dioxygenase-like lactoylglutathione lyase family enzyme